MNIVAVGYFSAQIQMGLARIGIESDQRYHQRKESVRQQNGDKLIWPCSYMGIFRVLDGAAVYLLASRIVTVEITVKEKNMRHKHSTLWAPARS